MMWSGQVVAVCASGPSMTVAVADQLRAEKVPCIVINDTWRRMQDAAALLAADRAWWIARDPRVSPEPHEFAGERISCCGEAKGVCGTTFVRPSSEADGGNGALHAARDVAAARGARLILLCGVDLRDDDLTHWHGLHKALRNPSVPRFTRARRAWHRYAAVKERPRIINCNPQSGLTCFERMPIEEALRA
jgi:hypothetical protein